MPVEAASVFEGLIQAAACFEDFRLPETFAGFSRKQYAQPVRYPVACDPQAWAAGSIPYLLTSCLELKPEGFHCKVIVDRPKLPRAVKRLELRGIHVG